MKHVGMQLALLSALMISCSGPGQTLTDMSRRWKLDSLGCNGDRYSMVDSLSFFQETLISASEERVLSLLGQPNERSRYHLYYYAKPELQCVDSLYQTFPNEIEVEALTVRFSANQLVDRVWITVP